MTKARVLLADAGEPVVAIPPAVVAVDVHVPLVVPAVEGGQYCTKHHPCHHPLKAEPISGLYFIRYRNTPMLRTKYFYFLESVYTTLSQTVIGDILGYIRNWIR